MLSEAASTIRPVGPDGFGVAGLMAKVGLTHGGFYAHFKSKDDLVAQAITQMFEDSNTRFQARTTGHEPAEVLAIFLDYYLSVRHRDTPDRGCPLLGLSGDLARMPAPARERFAEGASRLTGLITGLLERLEKPEPELLATSVVSEIVGAVADPARSAQILAASRPALKARLGLT
ncbi:MAG: TetR family transcriptional regulator [Rhodospirillales bacterium]|nr:TetR family transcriptional regulator [Rhodospirillales bacterium]